MSRALSSFIEARNAREAVSGGVKFNPIDPTGKLRAKEYDKDVYGNVPYQRVEFTAEQITAFFNLDLGCLRVTTWGVTRSIFWWDWPFTKSGPFSTEVRGLGQAAT